MVARAIGVRARSDAMMARGGAGPTMARQALTTLRGEIEEELASFVRRHTAWELATQYPEIVEQYVWLRRGFLVSLGEHVAQRGWDDGLGELRAAGNARSGARRSRGDLIELKTLPDYDWYIRWAKEDPRCFDVHSVRAVPVGAVLDRLGINALEVDADALSALQHWGRPDVLDSLGDAFASELRVRSLAAPVQALRKRT